MTTPERGGVGFMMKKGQFYVSIEVRCSHGEIPWPATAEVQKLLRKSVTHAMRVITKHKIPFLLVSDSRNPKRLKRREFWVSARVSP